MTLETTVHSGASEAAGSMRIIRHGSVIQKLSVSNATLFDMVAKGVFPSPFTIVPGGRAVGWLEHEVDTWILARSARQRGGE
jgi:prophage regulatory protein